MNKYNLLTINYMYCLIKYQRKHGKVWEPTAKLIQCEKYGVKHYTLWMFKDLKSITTKIMT